MQHISELVEKLCKTSISKPDKEKLINNFFEQVVNEAKTICTQKKFDLVVNETGVSRKIIAKIIDI